MFYLYILYSVSSDKYYIGYSDNTDRRLFEHNNNLRSTTYTSKHRPWVLKKTIELGDSRSFAMKIEKTIKKSKSRILVEKIIEEVNSLGDLAQLVRVPMCRD